jgi:N-acetyl-gamma-glutamyl-phosphate reductase
VKVGVLGASGYAGTELLRLAAGHPDMDVVVAAASRAAGRRVAEQTPALAAAYPDLVLEEVSVERLDGLDVLMSALPHGESQHLAREWTDRVGLVVDLAADFRLRDPGAYPRWYGHDHAAPDILARAVYGLPELHRDELCGARLIAAPGCYPTAAVLALGPLARAGLLDLDDGVVVDALSGVSGAGRSTEEHLMFGEVAGSAVAYGLLGHRHTVEMEQELGAGVLFTPHLVPMTRGILATCYARHRPGAARPDTVALLDALRRAYKGEPFVHVVDDPPGTKATLGSNTALVTARADERTGRVVAICAIDNLVKGAAGQAIQAMNVALGLPETRGLPTAGLYP